MACQSSSSTGQTISAFLVLAAAFAVQPAPTQGPAMMASNASQADVIHLTRERGPMSGAEQFQWAVHPEHDVQAPTIMRAPDETVIDL